MTSPHAIDREDVMAYLDGELPVERGTIVRQHLETCESCRRLAADLREVSARLSEWQVEPSPSVLDVSVRAALEASPLVGGSPAAPRSRWRTLFMLPAVRIAGMTAVAASAIVAAWITLRPIKDSSAVPVPTAQQAPLPSDALARSEPPPAASSPAPAAPTANAERTQPQRMARGTSSPRLDAIDEVKVVPQGQRGVPVPPANQTITSPPLSTPVPTSPPPPAPPPPPAAAAPPVITQTGAVAARSDAGGAAGGGRGGRGGGAGAARGLAAETLTITMDGTRNRLDLVTFLPDAANRPLVARRAELTIVTTGIDQARAEFDRVIAEQQAIRATFRSSSDAVQTPAIDAVIRIPVERFDAALKSLRALGRVTRDTQASEDLEIRMIGLSSKLTAVRSEETTLQEQLVRQRNDREAVLATEQALTRAREERARLEAELRSLYGRVTHGELTIRIEESKLFAGGHSLAAINCLLPARPSLLH